MREQGESNGLAQWKIDQGGQFFALRIGKFSPLSAHDLPFLRNGFLATGAGTGCRRLVRLPKKRATSGPACAISAGISVGLARSTAAHFCTTSGTSIANTACEWPARDRPNGDAQPCPHSTIHLTRYGH